MGSARAQTLKLTYRTLKGQLIRAFASYTPAALGKALERLGISSGDAVMMHASFDPFNGFRGSPKDVIDCILNVLGPQGHLFMMSLAYSGSSYDFVSDGKSFDVARTMSQMGILSEVFRRRQHVLRSANPIHPVLAWGPRARWIVSEHENLLYSCGPGSPFEKMLDLETKLLFFNVGFEYCTFEHYLEHRFQDCAPLPHYYPKPLEGILIDEDGNGKCMDVYVFDGSPLPIYYPKPLEAILIDEDGNRKCMKTYVFNPAYSQRRNSSVLKNELLCGGFLKEHRIGNTKLSLVRMSDALNCATRLVQQGRSFYKV